ncbi:MAG: GFA family protein [Gammaproteobacteria bacterium]|nr:GFA family protein [Gammaproteobacteria bacterium]
MTQAYQGSCHCGAIKLSYVGEIIEKALRCTCSICSRKGAMMSTEAIPQENLKVEIEGDNLGLYKFDSKIAKHYFCKTCGIYTHHETMRTPGHMRVNLGCIDGVETDDLEVTVFDGRNLL